MSRQATSLPHRTVWTGRPSVWRSPQDRQSFETRSGAELGPGVKLFHDADTQTLAIALKQQTGLEIKFNAFAGTFCSIVLDLPSDATNGLGRDHILDIEIAADTDTPLDMFVRLNVKHGPNTEQIIRRVGLDEGPAKIEYDLWYSQIVARQVKNAWVDVIFENPRSQIVQLSDIVLALRWRAPL